MVLYGSLKLKRYYRLRVPLRVPVRALSSYYRVAFLFRSGFKI